MLDVHEHLDALKAAGLRRRSRMVSGPQGPRVVLDGRPVLLLCSDNHLGLADHPRVREAAADAAMRWGAGAGGPRAAAGTMTLHRRLEERLAEFLSTDAALLAGSRYLANLGVIPVLARRGEVVFCDEHSHPSIADACRLAEAECLAYRHGDAEHLAWGLRQAGERAALVATDGVFGVDGDVAPLEELVRVTRRARARLLVDESHALGCLGPGGRGSVAEAGLEDEVDVVVGTLGAALGAYGGFVAAEHEIAQVLAHHARPVLHSTAPSPVTVAAAKAALEVLAAEPRRVERLQANSGHLREALARESFDVSGSHIVPLVVGEPAVALRLCELAREQGVHAEAVLPPATPDGDARVRLTVMATHTRTELREAAQVLARAALRCGLLPGAPPLRAIGAAPGGDVALPRAA